MGLPKATAIFINGFRVYQWLDQLFYNTFGLLVSCQPETIYDVGTLKPNADGEKPNQKMIPIQEYSIPYLFEEEVPPGVLEFMRTAYISLGDKELVVDRDAVQCYVQMLRFPQTDMLEEKRICSDDLSKISPSDPSSFGGLL